MENGVVHLQNKTTLASDIYRASPAIWGRCPLSFIRKNFPESVVEWNAGKMSLVGTQTTEIAGPIPGTKVFSTTALKVTAVSAVNSVEKWGGAITFGNDTDNESCALAQAYPTFRMSGVSGTDGPLWFEACFAWNSLLTATMGTFIGLGENELFTLATGVPFTGTGDAITSDGSLIGFKKGEDELGVIDTVVSDRAVAFTNVGAAEGLVSAANTFIKVGMLYIPSQTGFLGGEYDPLRVVRFYQDNVQLTTAISKTTLTGYTNLDANALGPIVTCHSAASGTATLGYLKWLRCVQLPPGVML